MKKQEITPSIKYFFKRLEDKYRTLEAKKEVVVAEHLSVPFDSVERFVRSIMTQNIFIHTVGLNGKHESTIMSKAAYSINKVVRIYYSTSMDHNKQGYIRIYPNSDKQLILVERLHGFRPEPELIYASKSEVKIVKFLTGWIMKRMDWDKTKLNNLELYKIYTAEERRLEEERIRLAKIAEEEQELIKTLDKHFGKSEKNKEKKLAEEKAASENFSLFS